MCERFFKGETTVRFLLTTIFCLCATTVFAADFPGPLTLDDCINIAIENNPLQDRSEINLKSTQKNVTRAFSNFLPSISLSSRFDKTGGESINEIVGVDTTVTPPTTTIDRVTVDFERENSSLGFMVQQTIFNGGWNFANLSAAKHNAKTAELNHQYSTEGLVLEVKQNYFDLLKKQQLLAVSREDLALSEKQLELSQALNEVGSAAKSDVLRSKATVAQKKLALLTSQNNVNLAFADLAATMGIDLNAEFEIADIDAKAPEGDLLPDVTQATEKAFTNRLDLKSVESSLKSTKSNVSMARSGYLPRITASASYGWNDDELKFIGDNTGWSYDIALSYNLFDGFDREAAYSQAKLAERASRKDIEKKKLDISLQVKRATLNLETAYESIQQADESLAAAEEDLRLAEERYRLGVATIVDLNTAQLNYTNARQSQVEALYNYELARANLDYVVGK